MNLNWTSLMALQQRAISQLCERETCDLPQELAEQLINLGLVELVGGTYCISPLGATLLPNSLH